MAEGAPSNPSSPDLFVPGKDLPVDTHFTVGGGGDTGLGNVRPSIGPSRLHVPAKHVAYACCASISSANTCSCDRSDLVEVRSSTGFASFALRKLRSSAARAARVRWKCRRNPIHVEAFFSFQKERLERNRPERSLQCPGSNPSGKGTRTRRREDSPEPGNRSGGKTAPLRKGSGERRGRTSRGVRIPSRSGQGASRRNAPKNGGKEKMEDEHRKPYSMVQQNTSIEGVVR